jgi:hypothetical protein
VGNALALGVAVRDEACFDVLLASVGQYKAHVHGRAPAVIAHGQAEWVLLARVVDLWSEEPKLVR